MSYMATSMSYMDTSVSYMDTSMSYKDTSMSYMDTSMSYIAIYVYFYDRPKSDRENRIFNFYSTYFVLLSKTILTTAKCMDKI